MIVHAAVYSMRLEYIDLCTSLHSLQRKYKTVHNGVKGSTVQYVTVCTQDMEYVLLIVQSSTDQYD